MQYFTGISIITHSISYMLSLTERVWEFRNDALWDTPQHALFVPLYKQFQSAREIALKIREQLERQEDDICRHKQQICDLQSGAESPQQALIILQELVASTAEQVKQLAVQNTKLESEIKELNRRQDDKQREKQNQLQGKCCTLKH